MRHATVLVLALLVGCAPSAMRGDAGADAASGDVTPSACVTRARTCAEITASFAANNAGVTVSCDESAQTFRVQSTGIPPYMSNQSTPNAIRDQGWVVTFPLQPACAANTTDTVNSRGPIGFMINGIPFYGPQDAMGRDAVIFEGPTLDDCVGHADQSCSYHYHNEPLCVFGVRDTAAQHPQADGHPAIVGYALDGFAVHASYSRAEGEALDACNGHTDSARGYHYHATRTSPYLLGCNRGVPSATFERTMNLCGATGMMMTMTDGGTTEPRTCTSPSECAGACGPSATGCTCATTPTGMRCVPTCRTDADCPPPPMGGALRCDTARGLCVPA